MIENQASHLEVRPGMIDMSCCCAQRSSPGVVAPRVMDMSKVTTPVLLHLLRAEIRFPWLFLLQCRLTVGGFKKTINPKFPPELVDLAVLPAWVYLNLKRRIGERKAFEIMRIAVLTGGIAHWNLAYRAAENERTFDMVCELQVDFAQGFGIAHPTPLSKIDPEAVGNLKS